jgi:hypothetical protein
MIINSNGNTTIKALDVSHPGAPLLTDQEGD